jgi:hypothetical protein
LGVQAGAAIAMTFDFNMNRIRCKLCENMILPTTAAVTGGLCMPCWNPKPTIEVDPNDPVGRFRKVTIAAFELMDRLEAEEEVIDDSEIRDTYFSLEGRMQSNCDSVAQGLLVVMASLCAKRRGLTPKLLPSAIAPVYALGFERYEQFAHYLRWLADFNSPYLGRPTRSGRSYLLELSTSEALIRDAIGFVWQSMRSNPPEEDEYIPHILRFNESEQGGTSNGG